MSIINVNDIFGFIHPSVDAHTLGISVISRTLNECGYRTVIGDFFIATAVGDISVLNNMSLLKSWLIENRITRLGFSYRLDPKNAQIIFGKLYSALKSNKLLACDAAQIKSLYFAGLPESCRLIKSEHNKEIEVFSGDETPVDSLRKLGVPESRISNNYRQSSEYDEVRLAFGKKIVESEAYTGRQPNDRSGYADFGTKSDGVVKRILLARQKNQLPIIRAHVGPYNSNYFEAMKEFKSWLGSLSKSGFLDVLSIGSSQLSQSDFGIDWGNRPNGGGVPINSEADLIDIWNMSRPMLVRTYAGTQNIPQLARIYERTINIAWHALSFWWFCKIDGRGSYDVKYNLQEHLETLKFIASSGKPFEPNVPHHFAFRGADDYTYVLSGYLAAKTAKKHGINNLILQVMLNTPKYTWGIQDLAKSRALLKLVRELEDEKFTIYLQPRAGLDYFSSDMSKAKIQLSAATAMMDDIDPINVQSPDIVHVVSFSEGVQLATPDIINESIKITLESLEEYRKLKQANKVENMAIHRGTIQRTQDIYSEVKKIITLIEKNYPDPYSPEGLYEIFKDGLLPVPYLWECRNEFMNAVSCNTSLINGGMKIVDENGLPIQSASRIENILMNKALHNLKRVS